MDGHLRLGSAQFVSLARMTEQMTIELAFVEEAHVLLANRAANQNEKHLALTMHKECGSIVEHLSARLARLRLMRGWKGCVVCFGESCDFFFQV